MREPWSREAAHRDEQFVVAVSALGFTNFQGRTQITLHLRSLESGLEQFQQTAIERFYVSVSFHCYECRVAGSRAFV